LLKIHKNVNLDVFDSLNPKVDDTGCGECQDFNFDEGGLMEVHFTLPKILNHCPGYGWWPLQVQGRMFCWMMIYSVRFVGRMGNG